MTIKVCFRHVLLVSFCTFVDLGAFRTVVAAAATSSAGEAGVANGGGSSTSAADTSGIQSQTPVVLQEIVVSAQRRQESIQTVPISMTALAQKAMDDLHIQNLSDLASIVPGLDVPPANGASNANSDIAIRGIFSGANAPTTQIYIDETPIAIRQLGLAAGPSGSFYPDIFDLDRVEVLRGPQGTLFGSSAMGGAIRFITPQPNLDQASGYSKAEIADTDHGDPSYAVGVAYGAPFVQGTSGFRVSGWFHSDGGFIDAADPYTDQIVKRNANSSSAFAGRAALTIVPTEALTITPAVVIQQQQGNDLASYWNTPYLGFHVSGDSASQPSRDSVTLPSVAIKYELPGMVLQSDTSYLDRSYDDVDDNTQVIADFFFGRILIPGVPPAYTSTAQVGGTRAWQQEFRLTSSGASRFQWVAGAYFRHAHETLSQRCACDLTPMTEAILGETSLQHFGVPNYIFNGQTLGSYSDFNTIDQGASLFGDGSIDLTARLKVSVGLRVEHSTVSDQRQVLAGPLNGTAYAVSVLPDQVGNPVTPRFTITNQYTEQDMVYATVAKGYRAGGGNSIAAFANNLCTPSIVALGLTSVPKTFTSDSLWSYELGAKDSLFGGRLSTQASAFYINWSNIQTSILLPSCSESFTGNLGQAVVRGFELQFEAIPLDGLKLGGSISYTDAYYPNAEYGPPVNGVAPLVVGAGDKLGAGIGGVSGEPNPVLPWTAAAHAEYSWGIGALWSEARSYIRADYRWLDADPAGDARVVTYDPLQNEFRNPAYSTLNLRFGVVRTRLDLSVFVNNATNSDPHIAYSDLGILGSKLTYLTAIRPLTVGLTALYGF